MRRNLVIIALFSVAALTLSMAGCSSSGGGAKNKSSKPSGPSKTIISGSAGNGMTVSLANSDGLVHPGEQDFTMTFFDSTGKVANLTSATLNFHIEPFGSTPAQDVKANFIDTGVPGSFHGKANLIRVGEWDVQITYDGPAGKGTCNLLIVVKP